MITGAQRLGRALSGEPAADDENHSGMVGTGAQRAGKGSRKPWARVAERILGACVFARLALCAALAAAGCGGESEPAAVAGWESLRPATLERTEVAAARVGHFIYVMGGFEPSGATSAATERYDIERDRWRRVADMPVALNHAAAVAYRGRVYVLGGYSSATGLSQEVATLYRYDPGRDRWRRLPSAPTARAALAAGVIRGRLYAAGGAAGRRGCEDARDLRLRAPPLARRAGHGDRARAPRRRRRARPLLRARGAVGGDQLRRRRGVRPARAPLAQRARHAQGARRDRRRDGARRPDRGGGRRGDPPAPSARSSSTTPRTRRWRALPDLPTPRHGLGVVSRGLRVFTIEGGDSPGFAFTSALEALVVPRP